MNTQIRYAAYSLIAISIVLTLLLAYPEANWSRAKARASVPAADLSAVTTAKPLTFGPLPSPTPIGKQGGLPTDRIVAGYGYKLLELLSVEQLPAEAPRLSDLGPAPGQRELRFAERDADPVRLMLGGIAEQLVHLRPEALLLYGDTNTCLAVIAAKRR